MNKMSNPKALQCLWSEAAANFAATAKKTELEGRLPTQGELEEHWLRIQKFLESCNFAEEYDSRYSVNDPETSSISSYSHGPAEFDQCDGSDEDSFHSNDDVRILHHGKSKAGQAYTVEENKIIWQAYITAISPDEKKKALSAVAKQLGRTYNGIVRHCRQIRENKEKSKRMIRTDKLRPASASSHTSDTETVDQSSTDTTSSNSESTQYRSSQEAPARVPTVRVAQGRGFLYTEEEDMAIWSAYLSSRNKEKRTKALRAVAVKYNRKYSAMMGHLQQMLAAQSNSIVSRVGQAQKTDERESIVNETRVVNQVSDISDSSSDSDVSTAENKPGNRTLTQHATATTSTTPSTHQTYTISQVPSVSHEVNRFTLRASAQDGTPLTLYGNSAEALAYYRSTVRQDVYAPEKADEVLGGFISSLRVYDYDMAFPIEVHDQVLCIVLACFLRAQRRSETIRYNEMFAAITSARIALQSTFFHLHGVSNRKLHSILKLLQAAQCLTITGGHCGLMHLDREIQSMAVLRRRHDRCLARRMRSEHRAYLANLLLWPLEAELEQVKIVEMEGVRIEVERVLDVLAREPKHTFLR